MLDHGIASTRGFPRVNALVRNIILYCASKKPSPTLLNYAKNHNTGKYFEYDFIHCTSCTKYIVSWQNMFYESKSEYSWSCIKNKGTVLNITRHKYP